MFWVTRLITQTLSVRMSWDISWVFTKLLAKARCHLRASDLLRSSCARLSWDKVCPFSASWGDIVECGVNSHNRLWRSYQMDVTVRLGGLFSYTWRMSRKVDVEWPDKSCDWDRVWRWRRRRRTREDSQMCTMSILWIMMIYVRHGFGEFNCETHDTSHTNIFLYYSIVMRWRQFNDFVVVLWNDISSTFWPWNFWIHGDSLTRLYHLRIYISLWELMNESSRCTVIYVLAIVYCAGRVSVSTSLDPASEALNKALHSQPQLMSAPLSLKLTLQSNLSSKYPNSIT